MKTMEILEIVESNGCFDNFRNWTEKEIAEWVYYNFDCSKYVAKNVAKYLV